MDERQDLLLRLGFSLNELGKQMEQRRVKIQNLLAQGYSYDAPEMVVLVKEYYMLQCQFSSLETQFQETKM